jgi:predicted NAD/FAD-dependent oxidoreductase
MWTRRAPRYSRRRFLQQASVAGAAIGLGPLLKACGLGATDKPIAGRMLGPDTASGHLLRGGKLPTPSQWTTQDAIVVGGGIAGLATARRLRSLGRSHCVLELEAEAGGNARAGYNAHTAYAWGAHYLPLPNPETTEVRELLEEMGLITGYTGGLPVYDERALVHAPEERLFYRGVWQRGLIPSRGLPARAQAEFERFFAETARHRDAVDAQGRPHFALPLDRSAPGSPRELDSLSLADYLLREGYQSTELHGYLDYCTRDDYGLGLGNTSAWAGLHYFAARRGLAANAEPNSELTWPMGNAYLARYLAQQARAQLRLRRLVHRIQRSPQGWEVWAYDLDRKQSEGYHCQQLYYASPLHTLPYVYADPPELPELLHTPWLVAQLHLRPEINPLPGYGQPLSWDNVNYGGQGLGYVVANHQQLRGHPGPLTLTYYRPLTHMPPAEARRWAQRRSHAQWVQEVLADLAGPHPALRSQLHSLDCWLWGHGMVGPRPGYLWGTERARLQEDQGGGLHLVHTDVSGISLFEEAYCRGLSVS